MSDIFGTSNYGGAYIKKNWFKLKDGEVAFRILPPLGELAKEGRWSVFWKVHYGYKNSASQLRTFESPFVKNNKTKMVEVPDAALERIEKLKAQFEEAKKTNNKELIAKLDKLVGQKGQFNLDSNHYLNVMDEAGNIGILKIRHRAKVALDDEIKRLRADGVDPLSPDNGRVFVFRRSGMGLDTSFKVSVKQETVDVPGFGPMKRDIVHKLTAEMGARCAVKQGNGSFRYGEAANLATLYKRPTSEQVARIVRDGAVAVDEILDTRASVASEGATGVEDYDDSGDYSAETSSQPAPAPTVAAPTVATTTAPAANKAAQAPVAVAPVQTLAEAPKAAPAAVADQSDADFLKSLGL